MGPLSKQCSRSVKCVVVVGEEKRTQASAPMQSTPPTEMSSSSGAVSVSRNSRAMLLGRSLGAAPSGRSGGRQ
jgi:hypothetical protein